MKQILKDEIDERDKEMLKAKVNSVIEPQKQRMPRLSILSKLSSHVNTPETMTNNVSHHNSPRYSSRNSIYTAEDRQEEHAPHVRYFN